MNQSQSVTGLLSSIADLEKTLRQLLKTKGLGPFHEDVQAVRSRLRDELQEIVFLDYDLAASKDVEVNLWKLVHYKTIEDFRRRLKDANARARRAGRPLSNEEKKELRVLTASFRAFLVDAMAFYLRFITRLRKHFDLSEVEEIVLKQLDTDIESATERYITQQTDSQISTEVHYRAIATCHRCLIYLGDLARYREIHADRKEKNWSSARLFYHLAIRLLPSNGNPFNQLAVIATYAGNELEAVECYFRSLIVTQPFATAVENLIILYDKVQNRNEEIDDLVNSLLRDFIVLHGKVVGKHRSSLAEFTRSYPNWINKFQNFVPSGSLEKNVLRRLFLINMAVIYITSRTAAANHTTRSIIQGLSDDGGRMTELHAPLIAFTIDMIKVLLKAMSNLTSEQETSYFFNSSDSHVPDPDNVSMNLLPTLWLVSAWIKAQWLEDRELIPYDREFWTLYSSCLTKLAETVDHELLRSNRRRAPDEDAELSGFLPLEKYFQSPRDVNDASASDTADIKVNSYENHDTTAADILIAQIVDVGLFFTKSKEVGIYLATTQNNKPEKLVFSTSPEAEGASPESLLNGDPHLSLESRQATGSLGNDDELRRSAHRHLLSAGNTSLTGDDGQIASPDVDEDAFGHKINLPTQELQLGGSAFLQPSEQSAPMSVPGTMQEALRRSDSPDSSGLFGTSSDAVNTMAFLGLGSPLRDNNRSARLLEDILNGGSGDYGDTAFLAMPSPTSSSGESNRTSFHGVPNASHLNNQSRVDGSMRGPTAPPGLITMHVAAFSASDHVAIASQRNRQSNQTLQSTGEYHYPFGAPVQQPVSTSWDSMQPFGGLASPSSSLSWLNSSIAFPAPTSAPSWMQSSAFSTATYGNQLYLNQCTTQSQQKALAPSGDDRRGSRENIWR